MTCKDVLLFASAIGGMMLLIAGWVVVGYIDRLQSRVGAVPGKSHEAVRDQSAVAGIGARVERLESRVAVLHWGAAFLLGGVAVLSWQALKPMLRSRRVTKLDQPRKLRSARTKDEVKTGIDPVS